MYLVKHRTGVDMESLDLDEVDKEMAIAEAAQSSAPSGVFENTLADDAPTGDAFAGDNSVADA